MRRCETRLYNMFLPVWLLWWFPATWLIILPANLLIDTAVLLCALLALRLRDKRRVMKRMWWRIWLRGFVGDGAGVIWLSVSLIWSRGGESFWAQGMSRVLRNPFAHPLAFFWTLAGVVISGVCIYAMDRVTLEWEGELTDREARIAALALAVVTAPWTFFIPMG